MSSTVMVAGKFDPIHDGHVSHILKAAALGNYLVIVTHSDDVLDRIKPKGHAVPYWARIALLRGILMVYGIRGRVACSVDDDGTVTQTLLRFKPDIFAKGGDRTASNMPQSEIDACSQIGCKIVYGVGELLNSSTKIWTT